MVFKTLFEEHGEFTMQEIETENPKLWAVYQQAKQMEEQQHRNTFNAGFVTIKWDKENEDVFKQYYNETFNTDNNE